MHFLRWLRLRSQAAWLRFAAAWQGQRAYQAQGMQGYLLAVFLTHALLRLALLLRHDAYGLPLVGKADWYAFHAFSIDFLWVFGYSLPLLLLGSWFSVLSKAAWILLVAAHSVLLVFTVMDHETLRFLGMHLDPSFLGTYGNTASIREVLHFVADDRSIRYLPYLLIFGCIPFSLFAHAWLRRRVAWLTDSRLHGKPVFWLLATALITWLYLHVIWPGGFRMKRLQPFVDTAWMGLMRPEAEALPSSEWDRLAQEYQARWLNQQGDSTWVFPDLEHAYFRQRRERFCADANPSATAFCQGDADGDGFPAKADCDDLRAETHAGAVDIPGDGLDQDCDGVDAQPVNVVLLIFESHRAMHCGHLRPYGATASATPVLDSLAAQGRFWTRFNVGGVPTINALMAIHLGIVQHPTRFISSDFTTMANQGFPAVLGRHGYRTQFFSAADPAWDNQTPWLRQWYQGVRYDRSRENDAAMLDDMAQWMLDSLKSDRPFFLASMSKTNHYPFNPVPGVESSPAGASLQDRMTATMRYADAALGRFLNRLRSEPWFHRTVFIILGDHGFPLGEHGSSTIGYGLYTESTWIPFVVVGQHARLPKPGPMSDVASQIDIGPTVLDLAGINAANHFMGHSLLRPHPEGEDALVLRDGQGMLERGHQRWHGPLGSLPREQGYERFDALGDKGEHRNLHADAKASPPSSESEWKEIADRARLHTALLESDRLWPLAHFPDSSKPQVGLTKP